MYARPRSHNQYQADFIMTRRALNAHFHGIKVASNVGGIDMRDRNVDTRARAADLFGRRNYGLCSTENLAHRITSRHMPQRTVLQFAASADDSALAITFDRSGISSQYINQTPGQPEAKRLQLVHVPGNIFDKPV